MLLSLTASSVWGQGISGLSVAKNPANSSDLLEDGTFVGAQRKSVVAVQSANATSFSVRYAKIVGTDTGAFTSRTENFTGNYTITFSVTAPGSYSLAVNTRRTGALTLVDDGTGSATATLGALTGSQAGGSLSGSLSLAAVSNLSGGGGGNTPFNQTNVATITGVSNGVPQVHTLTFAWAASCNSNGGGISGITGGDECAVRMGLPVEYSGETAGDYPGSGNRTQSNDGHFVTVTFGSPCGNGTLELGDNEECDEGAANGTAGSCCNGDCSLKSGNVCRGAAGDCDIAETCDGLNGACPADSFQPAGTVCRAGSAGDVCDFEETCTGTGAACPLDIVLPAGTVCRTATGDCDTQETCDGVAKTCPSDAVVPAGTTCRAAADVCDVDEECDGVGKNCPADGFVSAGTSCRPAVDVCDAEETCTGSGAACPPDGVQSAVTVCRTAADVCDTAETCDGVGTACPADGFAAAGTVCRSASASDVCDIEETCDGLGVACPPDGFLPAGTVCRSASAGDVCDIEETCTGSSGSCPPDAVEPAGTVCRASADVCDVEDTCDGVAKACPPDAVEAAGTTCRAVAGDCDVEEQCDGASTACPADGFATAGTSCRAAADLCDAEEACSGSSAACPVDGVEPNGTVCRAAADLCDAAETCDGVGTACPADGVLAAGTECRASAGVCDVAEECDGVGASCPADAVVSAGTECRAAAGECDVAEECDGVATDCPSDGFVSNGTACTDDGQFCTGTETCQAGSCVGDGDPCGMAVCDEGTDMCLAAGCGASPLNGCRTAEKSILLYKDKSPNKRDKLVYKWIKGQTTTQADFADPINSAQYDLCLYAGTTAALIFQASVPPSASKWKAISDKGFKYKDRDLVEDGTQRIILKGRDGNKSKIIWKGKGENLSEPVASSLPVAMADFPVIVQVVNNDNGMCFETSFDSADVKKNEADQLKLKDK